MIQPDLFRATRPKPSAPVSLASTGQFVADPRGAAHFIHPCAVCGDPNAAFGTNVRLRAAIAAGDPRLAGVWLCHRCEAANNGS